MEQNLKKEVAEKQESCRKSPLNAFLSAVRLAVKGAEAVAQSFVSVCAERIDPSAGSAKKAVLGTAFFLGIFLFSAVVGMAMSFGFSPEK